MKCITQCPCLQIFIVIYRTLLGILWLLLFPQQTLPSTEVLVCKTQWPLEQFSHKLSSFCPPSPLHPSHWTSLVESSLSNWFWVFTRHSSSSTRWSVQGLPLIFLCTTSYSLVFFYPIMKKDENEMGSKKVTRRITEQNGIVRSLDANWFS